MTDSKPSVRLLGQLGAYGLGSLLQRGLAFLVLPWVTRILGPEAFGEAVLASSVGILLSYLYSLGLNNAVVRTYHDEPAKAPRTRWAALQRTQAAVAVAIAVIFLLTGPLWSRLVGTIGWSTPLKIAVVAGVAIAIQTTAQGVLRAQMRARMFVAVSLIQGVLGGISVIVLSDRFGAAGYMGGLLIGATSAAVAGVIMTWKKPLWDRTAIVAGVTLGLPFVVHRSSLWILALADRVIIETNLGLAAVGRFQVVYVVATAFALVIDAAQSAWAPQIYSSAKPLGETGVEDVADHSTRLATYATVVVAGLAPLGVAIVAPATYGYLPVVVGVVAGVSIMSATHAVSMAVLLDRKRTLVISIASGSAAIANIILNLWLVPRYELVGAAVATWVAYTIQASIGLLAARRESGLSLHAVRVISFWSVGSVATLGVAALPTSPLGWFLRLVAIAAAAFVALPSVGSWRRAAENV